MGGAHPSFSCGVFLSLVNAFALMAGASLLCLPISRQI